MRFLYPKNAPPPFFVHALDHHTCSNHEEGCLLKSLLPVALALLLSGCSHYSNAGPLCEPSPLSGEDCKHRQPVGNYLMDKYHEWERYQ